MIYIIHKFCAQTQPKHKLILSLPLLSFNLNNNIKSNISKKYGHRFNVKLPNRYVIWGMSWFSHLHTRTYTLDMNHLLMGLSSIGIQATAVSKRSFYILLCLEASLIHFQKFSTNVFCTSTSLENSVLHHSTLTKCLQYNWT